MADRIMVALFSLALVFAATLAALLSMGWAEPLLWLENFTHPGWNETRLGMMAASIILGLLGIKLFSSALYRPQPTEQALVYHSTLGQVNITIPALESLILKAARRVPGVKEITPRIRALPEGIAILLRATILPDLNIPGVGEELQQKVKAYLEETTGAEVLEVKVVVETVAVEARARVE